VIYWLVIFAGTHVPTTAMPSISVSDKLCHALAFCGLSFLLAWALPSHGRRLTHVVWAGLIALVYACVDELTQYLIPGRKCDLWDMAADGVGIVVGLGCYVVLRELLLQMRWGRNLLQLLSR
jgi:VanZ family protein